MAMRLDDAAEVGRQVAEMARRVMFWSRFTETRMTIPVDVDGETLIVEVRRPRLPK